MKAFLWIIIPGFLMISSCSDDIDILTGSDPVPVVYCIIDPLDSVYRVLLTKTFAGNRSAQELAQNPEMISYRKAKVSLEAWDNGYKVWETTFAPVTYQRDTGYFSSEPGCAFEAREVLSDYFGYPRLGNTDSLFDDLRLVVDYDDSQEPAYARIGSKIGKPGIIYPIYNYKGFNLCDSIPYYLEFYSAEDRYYDLRFKIKYSELTDIRVEKIYDFSFRQNIKTRNGTHIQIIDPDKFFLRFAQGFPDTKGVVRRDLVSIDLDLYIGSSTLRTYFDTYYSDNDHGYQLWNCFHNGIGLFALKSCSSLSNLKMDQRTLDSLAEGRFTKDLKFNRW